MSQDPAIRLGPFHIPGLKPRHVRVFVPPRGRVAPPVLYMFDGQNIFDDAPSYAGGWRLHEAALRLSPRRFRRPVIVGIEHGGEERIRELSPWPTRHGPGGADALLGWICGELVPGLAGELGLSRGPENTFLGGSSMGGLCALYGHFARPETFGGALSMSPSLWLDGGRIFEDIGARSRPWTSILYLDAGAQEAGGRMLRSAERMLEQLQRRGYGPGALRFRADPKGKHREADWRRRAPDALRFLFPRKRGG
jgi:predicted alpha/beta superfamily hydrolase